MRRPGRLDGRTCLIVGGTGGIGLASARRFLEEGARVVVAGQSPEVGRSAMAQLAPLGPVWEIAFELASGAPEVARLFTFALDALGGRLDVLLHVAGISGRKFGDGPLHECSDGGWDRVMEVNAAGVFLTNRAAVRFMLRQPVDAFGLRGTVVNVGLGAGPRAGAGAVRDDRLRGQQGGRPLADPRRRGDVCPGPDPVQPAASRPDRHADGHPGRERPARSAPYVAARQPMAGGPGSAEDVAEAALYLCEPAVAVRHRLRAGGQRRLVRLGGHREGRRTGRRGSVRAVFQIRLARRLPSRGTPGLSPTGRAGSARAAHDRSTGRPHSVSLRRAGGDRRDRGDATAGDPRGGRALRRDDPGRPAGARLRHGALADGRRGDVPALRVVPRASTRSSSCR